MVTIFDLCYYRKVNYLQLEGKLYPPVSLADPFLHLPTFMHSSNNLGPAAA